MSPVGSCPQLELVFRKVVESLGEGDLLGAVCQQKPVFRFYSLPPHLLSASSSLMEYRPQPEEKLYPPGTASQIYPSSSKLFWSGILSQQQGRCAAEIAHASPRS